MPPIVNFETLPVGSGGWSDDGTIVRLTTSTDAVAIGTASLFGTEKLRIIGDTRNEGKFWNITASGSGSDRGILSWQFGTDTDGARFFLRKARGTASSPSAVSNAAGGDNIGCLHWQGYDGSNYQDGIGLHGYVDGAVAAGSVPMRLELATGATGAGTLRTTWKSDGTQTHNCDSGGSYSWSVNSVLRRTLNDQNLIFETSNTSTDRGVVSRQTSSDNGFSNLILDKRRGASSAVQNADGIGRIRFAGLDSGGSMIAGASIKVLVDAAPGAGSVPMRLEIYTGTSGDGTLRSTWDRLGAQTHNCDATGSWTLQHNSTNRIRSNSTGLGFYTAAPVAQPADMGALTDSTTGTANGTVVDVGAVFNQATLNDNFADLIAKINAIRTALRNLGLMA